MAVHHHGGAVANQNAVHRTLCQDAGERVVIARHHRKLAAFGFCAGYIFAAHAFTSPSAKRANEAIEYRSKCCRIASPWYLSINRSSPGLTWAPEGSMVEQSPHFCQRCFDCSSFGIRDLESAVPTI